MLQSRTIFAKQLKFLNGVSVLPSRVMEKDAVPLRMQPPEEGFMDVPEMLALPSRKIHTFYSGTNIFGDTAQSWAPFFTPTILVLAGLLTDPPAPLGLPSRADTRASSIAWDESPSSVFTDGSIGYKNTWVLSESSTQRALQNMTQWCPWAWRGLHHGRVSPSSEDTKLKWIYPSVHEGFFVKQSGKRHVTSFYLNDTSLGNSILLPVVLSKA